MSNPGGNRKYLSCSNSGVVDLWDKDDNSGRQQWEMIKKSNGTFNIMSVGVKDKFLSCNTTSGVDLWNTDDNSGRQQWKLTPENLKIVDITFDAAHSSKTAMPDFIINSNISNNSDVAQTMTATYERVAVSTSSFEHQSGFCYEVSVETEFGLPGLVEGKVSVTSSTTQTWTEGKTETREDRRTYAFPVNVPPRSTITTTASVSQVKLDVPYVVTAISSETGETIRSTGIWKGVSLGNISYKIIQK